MPLSALFFLIAMLLPLASFIVLAVFGKRVGRPIAGWIATALVAGTFALSLAGMIAWFNGGQISGVDYGPGDTPLQLAIHILPASIDHAGFFDPGIYLDSLTVAMINMIALIMLLVHAYSMGFIDNDRYARYFRLLALEGFALIGIVLSATLTQMFVFWIIAAIGSFLLTGKLAAVRKALIIEFIGIVAFLIGMVLASQAGTLKFADLSAGAAASLLLICAAMARSGQFPFQVWLPDAMDAPTPALAMVHGTTFLAGGGYLLARIFPILSPDVKAMLVIIGIVTLLLAALVACAQNDIKRILAFAAISQMGYVFVGLGAGSWIGAMFHLITSAFIIALLFLATGSITRSTGGRRNLLELGGLLRNVPVTAACFAVGALAISAVPFSSGFYSRGTILLHAGALARWAEMSGMSRIYRLWFWAPLVGGTITAFYMTRCWMLCFLGEVRGAPLERRPREHATLIFPMVILAAISIIGGSRWMDIRRIVAQSPDESENIDAHHGHQFSQVWPADIASAAGTPAEGPMIAAQHWLDVWRGPSLGIGFLLAIAIYWRGFELEERFLKNKSIRTLRSWLARGMEFDALYEFVFIPMFDAAAWVIRKLGYLLWV